MTEPDRHLSALMQQCATYTPLGRLSGVEQHAVLAWLIDNGHMKRTGKPIEVPRQAPHPIGSTNTGQPIFAAGADHSPTETVSMGKVDA